MQYPVTLLTQAILGHVLYEFVFEYLQFIYLVQSSYINKICHDLSFSLTCTCLMAGVRLVKCDVRPSHDVTSDRHANLAHPVARISQYDKTNMYHSSL